ncbi:beta-N-acetylhexosaminidase [bacterium]|nr:MAG: beta-N-acetylhexosaminidase [bacterium]
MAGFRAGRLLCLGFEGTSLPEGLVKFAREQGLGGVILFRKNCPDAKAVAALTAEVRERLIDPEDGWIPLVAVDQEGGRVERIKEGVPRVPPAKELSRLGDREIEAIAFAQSKALKSLGIDLNLSPVCDILHPGESGAIGDRSFGENPRKTASAAAAFYRGMRRGGVAGCAKHFPGHGASPVDTHLGPGTVNLPLETLDEDMEPFRALIYREIEAVMACHLAYPKADPLPATLSPFWLKGTLRDGLGFRGAVISDDFEMGGLRKLGPLERLAPESVNAGCDLLIFGGMLGEKTDPETIAKALSENVSPARFGEAVERIWKIRPSPIL